MYDSKYDMHITFYGKSVDIETVDYEISINLPDDCSVDELSDLLRIGIRTLIGMESEC